MSLISKIFGKGKEKVQTPQAAMDKLSEVEELLQKKQEHLEQKINTELASARRHGTKNKRLALQALRRKKNHEKQLENVDGVLNTITVQKNALENATMNADVMQVMSHSSKALKKAHGNITVEKVESIMDEIATGIELDEELQQAWRTEVGDFDSDELEQELENLEREAEDHKIHKHKYPVAPSNDLSHPSSKAVESYTDEEEKELKKLASWST